MNVSKQPTFLQELIRFRLQASSLTRYRFQSTILGFYCPTSELFLPFTMISERRFLLVLSRRVPLFIKKNGEGKGAMGRKVFLAIIDRGILGSQGRIFVKNLNLMNLLPVKVGYKRNAGRLRPVYGYILPLQSVERVKVKG